jgi:hypothetical protein
VVIGRLSRIRIQFLRIRAAASPFNDIYNVSIFFFFFFFFWFSTPLQRSDNNEMHYENNVLLRCCDEKTVERHQ